MMRALAVVTKVSPDPKDPAISIVGLSCEQQTSCSGCASKSHCATGQVTKAIGNKQHAWNLSTQTSLSVGDIVEIGLPEKELLSVASIVYLVPLLGLFLGALLGAYIANIAFSGAEWPSIVFGALGALISGLIIKRRLRDSQAVQQVTLVRTLGQPMELK